MAACGGTVRNLQGEKNLLAQKLVEGLSDRLKEYATENPDSQLKVEDVREVLVKIIDYLDIAEVSGFSPWCE